MIYQSILLLPLLGALIAGFGASLFGDKNVRYVATALVSLTALLSIYIFFSDYGLKKESVSFFTWIDLPSLTIDWSFRNDALTRMMLPVVTIVSALVHIYSFGYMHEDPSKPRFFAYLSLFTFMMLALVTSDNIVQLFFGWEGVGLASYLLIGFWYHKESACAASMKAFVVNRVADCALLIGLGLIYSFVGSFDYDAIFSSFLNMDRTALSSLGAKEINFLWGEYSLINIICAALFIGAMGKSAQFLLHTWLPDAMEGPTPVSALIHAATMVTAGVFLVSRMSYLFEFAAPAIHTFIIIIGSLTCLFAATVALTQFDIKRVIAYSTCSQLGYMFFAAGVGAYQAALFHLFTHAFFKAMLFLGAGSVIHAMHHEQDMRNMGGLWRKIKPTAILMIIGTLAITGVGIPIIFGHGFGFAGFYSKDIIIESAFASDRLFSNFAFMIGIFVAFLTSFYSWRLIFLVFFGESRGDEKVHAHAHEAPSVMTIPVMLLSLGALLSGMLFYGDFVGHHIKDFWVGSIMNIMDNTGSTVLDHAHHVPILVKISPLIASLLGFLISWICYIKMPSLPQAIVRDFSFFYNFLHKKWFFDEIYNVIFIKPYQKISVFLARSFDYPVIDFIICGIPQLKVKYFGRISSSFHSGYLYHYAFSMILGAVFLLFIAIFGSI